MSPEVENVLRAAVVVAAFTTWAVLTVWLNRRRIKRRNQKALEAWNDKTRYGNYPGAVPAQTPRVECDLELDDGRPTDPGEEITEVSRYAWDEESGMQPAARKLGRMVGKDRGDLP